MTPDDTTPDDERDDLLNGDTAMMVGEWYRSAAPAANVRQAAIDRLFVVPTTTASLPAGRRGWSASRRWQVGLALAASVVVAVAFPWSMRQTPPDVAEVATRMVAFQVRIPSRVVHQVALTGDFNGWDPLATPMHREGLSDVWKIAIPLPPGRHVYSFVVDGTEWVIDPLAPSADFDDLGPANVIAISGAGD